jgi:hypothetical protein
MSDPFANLWSSSAPSKPQPQKLTAATTGNRRPQQDVFALLSSTGSSTSSSRSITPGAAVQKKPTTHKPNPGAGGLGEDAFSGLLSGSLASSNNSRMTIAERAAQAERQKLEGLRKQHHAVTTQASSGTWAGLDSLVNSSSPAAVNSSGLSTNPDSLLGGDDWGFDSAPASKSTPPIVHPEIIPAPPIDDGQDWSLDDFGIPATRVLAQPTAHHSASTKPKLIWDLDDIASQSSSSKLMSSPPERTNSPGDFDFGNRENPLLADDSDHEGDILGVLGKPVDSIPKRPSSSVRRSIYFPLRRTY